MLRDLPIVDDVTIYNNQLNIILKSKWLRFQGSYNLGDEVSGNISDSLSLHVNYDYLITIKNNNHLIHPSDIPKVVELLKGKQSGERFELQCRVVSADGSIRKLMAKGELIIDEGEKDFEDIVAQLDLELKFLQHAEVVAGSGSWKWNLDTNEVFFTENFYCIHGLDPSRQLSSWEELFPYIHKNDRHKISELSNIIMNAGDATTIEYRVQPPTEETQRLIRTEAEIFVTRKGERYCVGTAQDITPQRTTEIGRRTAEQMLKETEELACAGSWEYDMQDGRFTWSEGMYRLFDMPKGTPVTPEIYLDVVLEDDRPDAEKIVSCIRHNQCSFEETIRIRTNERVKILKVKGIAINGKGHPSKVIGIDLDITAITESEEARKEQSHLITHIAETIPDVISVVNLVTRRIEYMNQDIFGNGFSIMDMQSPEEKKKSDYVHPEDAPGVEEYLKRFDSLADDLTNFVEYRARNKEGQWQWFRAHGKVFKRNSRGKPTHCVNVVQNITSYKKAQDELIAMKELFVQRAEDRYRQLFNSIDEGFCIVEMIYDGNGNAIDFRFIETNPAFEKQTGFMNAKGKTARELRPELEDQWFHEYGKVALTREPMRFVQEAEPGDERWFEVYAFPAEEGKTIRVAILFNDITERRRAEQNLRDLNKRLQEIDQAKTTFFSNVSHEFRTPLTLLLAPLEDLIQDGSRINDEKYLEKLQMVHRNAVRLQKLVNDLLDFSRMEAGRMDALFQPIDLAQYTRDLANNFRSVVEKAGLRLLVSVDDIATPVYVDKSMWEKIVFNLLSNAFKFTFEGGIEVSLHTHGNLVELQVRDTGAGITEEDQKHLFERFRRIEGVKSRALKGSGIGLALVREFVKIHGGTVSVSSALGQGSIFTVQIPTGKEHLPVHHVRDTISATPGQMPVAEDITGWLPEEERDVLLPKNDPVHSGKMPLVLVVDDNADMRKYLRTLLIENYNVITLENGAKAHELLRRGTIPDLILSDVMMPEMDGFSLLNIVKSNKQWNYIPVILISARAGEESRVEGMEYGADDYLVKPFSSREVIAHVNARIEISRLRNQREELLREANKKLEQRVKERTKELQESRDSIREQKDLLQRCLNAMPQLVWTTDPLGNFVMFNEQWYSYTGLPQEQVESKTYIESGIIHRSQVAEVKSKWRFSINEGIPYSNETLIRSKEGEYRWHLDHIMPIKNDAGEIYMWVGTLTDVHEQFVAEKKAEEHRNLLEAVFNSSPNTIQVLDIKRDDDSRIVDFEWRYFNKHAKDTFLTDDLSGKRLTELYPEAVENGLVEKLKEAALRNEPVQFELLFKPEGKAWYDVSAVKLEDSIVVTLQDITRRIEQEQELKSLNDSLKRKNIELQSMNEQLSTFAFVASHDLREPLRKIHFFVSGIAQTDGEKLSQKARFFYGKALDSVQRMDALITDILKFSRTNTNPDDFRDVDLNRVLAVATNDLSEFIKEKNATIDYQTLPCISGNYSQLTQLFENLISNGIKFGRPGVAPKVEIKAKTMKGSKTGFSHLQPEWHYVVVEVSDNGIGFDEQYLPKIFQMFQRLHGISEYPGTGMGLAICKKIMENHDGFISACSTPGEGSTFTCYFPVRENAMLQLQQD